MTIVPIGNLVLQVSPREQSEFVPALCSVIQRQILYTVGRCLEETLKAELEHQLGRGRYRRRRHYKEKEIERQCSRCGSHGRQGFRRNSRYARYLDTHWGRVALGVPQAQCVCSGNVPMSFRMLRHGQWGWDDLAMEIGMKYHRGLNYRQIELDFEVFSDKFDELEPQARKIASWGENVYVKIPATNTRRKSSGELVCRLAFEGMKLNVTVLLTLQKVDSVSRALGNYAPIYISVFARRIVDTRCDPISL